MTRSESIYGWALLPLRAFLGVTFIFAGLQKLANPSFFDATNPASIQSQMAASAPRSPIHALVTPLSAHAAIIGVVIAIGELASGAGAFFGLFTRIAAVGGLLISLNLFLVVSFHTNPYYTGSDIVFVFAWLPLLIAGGGPLSLDTFVSNVAGSHGQPVDTDRRRLLGAMTVGLGALALVGAGTAAGIGRLLHTASVSTTKALGSGGVTGSPAASASAPVSSEAAISSTAASAVASQAPSTGTPGTTSSPTHGSPTKAPSPTPTPVAAGPPTPARTSATSSPEPSKTPATPQPSPSKAASTKASTKPAGTAIGAASNVPVRGAASFQDPASGDPALVVQPSAGTFLGFDAVCPHAGCTVDYQPQGATFVCPCHGSQFNGATGAVEVGPASRGLRKISVVKGSDGQLYAS